MKYTHSLKTIWSDNFSSQSEVEANGGVISGSPTFLYHEGCTLDGTNDYITYNVPNTFIAHPQLSFVIEFVPDFASDDGNGRVFFDSTVGLDRILLYKSSTDILTFFARGSSKAVAAESTFGPYWKVGKRNVLVVATESGNINMYLNGYALVEGDTSTYEVMYPTEFYIGASYAGALNFDGTIKNLSIHNRIFTASEAQALYDNSLFNYENKADVYLDFKSLSGDTIIDRSPHGYHFTNVNGTFSAPGIDLDGTSAYLVNNSASGIYNNTEQSMVMSFKPDFVPTDSKSHYFWDSTNGSRYLAVKASNGDFDIFMGTTNNIVALPVASYIDYWRLDGVNVLVVASKSSGDTDAFLNGVKIVSADSTPWTPSDPSDIYLGCYYNIGSYFDGEIFHFSAYPMKLSPVQAEHITQSLLSRCH